MARIQDLSLTQQTGLTLDRYQELLGLPIAAFNGLNKPDETPVYECSTIWRQFQRDNLARYLAIAEEKREQELGYFIAPKYVEAEENPISSPTILHKKYLISVGKKTITTLVDDVAVTFRDVGGDILDPVTLSVTPTPLTSDMVASGIVIQYKDEDVSIQPKSITISEGVVTVLIPRSRLVKPELNDDREDPLQYDNDDNFVTTVDIKYVSYDAAEAVKYISFGSAFVETSVNGTVKIKNNRLSIVELDLYAIQCYVGFLDCSNTSSPISRISYLSGIENSAMVQMQTLRLAHCLMPFEPCACEATHQYWRDDVTENPQDIVTPYGNKNGAVEAWIADSRAKVGQGGKFPNMRLR